MEAIAWTAIALLATTLVGSFFYLGNRIDSLSADLGLRIDAQGADLGRRIEALSARIDGLSGRFDQHLERHAG